MYNILNFNIADIYLIRGTDFGNRIVTFIFLMYVSKYI